MRSEHNEREQDADGQERECDHGRAERVVHGGGLRRHRRGAVSAVAPVGEQRPLHAGRGDGVAHPPQRPNHLRHRRRVWQATLLRLYYAASRSVAVRTSGVLLLLRLEYFTHNQ